MVKQETVSVGIQNRNTLKGLFPRRLAAKNSQNSNTPTIQNLGEKMFSTSRATTAGPVEIRAKQGAKGRIKLGFSQSFLKRPVMRADFGSLPR